MWTTFSCKILALTSVVVLIPGCITGRKDPCSVTNEKVLFTETFDACPEGERLPEGWWAEGGEKVWVEDGKLYVRANAGGEIARDRSNVQNYVATVWNKTRFPGNIRIEFDVHVVAAAQGHNNINFFFLYSDPSGKPLYETRASRANADYKFYHSLNGYIVTFLQGKGKQIKYHPDGSPKARFRMRRCNPK